MDAGEASFMNKYWAVALALMGLLSCGKLGTIEHNGVIQTKITVDDVLLNAYFARVCCRDALGAPASDLEVNNCAISPSYATSACAANHTGEFLQAMSSLIEQGAIPVSGL